MSNYPAPISRTTAMFVSKGWTATADREWTFTRDGQPLAIVREADSGRFTFRAGDDVEGGHPSLTAAMIAAEDALGIL